MNGVFITWIKNPSERKIGSATVLLKVATISPLLDYDKIPDYVLDYVVYRQLCTIIIGFQPDSRYADNVCLELVNKYTQKEDAEDLLSHLNVYL
jgi:hypothetical protein